jgi:hypothetical protein
MKVVGDDRAVVVAGAVGGLIWIASCTIDLVN